MREGEPVTAPARPTPSRFGRDPTASRSGENTAAALLLGCTLVAIVWANSPWSQTYVEFWNTELGLHFGGLRVDMSVKHLVNDAAKQDQARVGVLAASLLALVLGWLTFRVTDWLSPPVSLGATLIREIDPDRDHLRGNPNAPMTLVEYGDFECPFCSRATGSIDEVREYFGPDRLRYVWRHLPQAAQPPARDGRGAGQ